MTEHVSEAVQLHPEDNVATVRRVLRPSPGTCVVGLDGVLRDVELPAPVEFGHKIALVEIPVGTLITKYGQTIGVATAPIAVGEHVHVHNVVGARDTGQGEGAASLVGERTRM
jgi:hypothetical protein